MRCRVDSVDHAVEQPKNVFGGHPWETKACQHFLRRTSFCWWPATERKINFGSSAINAVVARRIVVTSLIGCGVPDCGTGLMFADPESDVLCGHATEAHESARKSGRCRARQVSSRCLPGPQARFGAWKPDHVERTDPALDHRTWATHQVPRWPESCIAPRRMNC